MRALGAGKMVAARVVAALACAGAAAGAAPARRAGEFLVLPGHTVKESTTRENTHWYMANAELPRAWDWRDVDGYSYGTWRRGTAARRDDFRADLDSFGLTRSSRFARLAWLALLTRLACLARIVSLGFLAQ